MQRLQSAAPQRGDHRHRPRHADANAAIRVHDRMPVILGADAARRWLQPGPLPAELLVPYPAEVMTAWRVDDAAQNSRIEPHAGMTEPMPE